jgi:hypothetical protein
LGAKRGANETLTVAGLLLLNMTVHDVLVCVEQPLIQFVVCPAKEAVNVIWETDERNLPVHELAPS